MRLQHTLIRDGIGIVVNIGAGRQGKGLLTRRSESTFALPGRIRRASYEKLRLSVKRQAAHPHYGCRQFHRCGPRSSTVIAASIRKEQQ